MNRRNDRYPRCPTASNPAWEGNSCIHSTERADFAFMGYSIRLDISDPANSAMVHSYRFTEWYPWNGTALMPVIEDVRATELYNHTERLPVGASPFDSFENINLAPTANQALVAALRAKLHQEFAI